MIEIAILDDYQKVALDMADWLSLSDRANVRVFSDTITDFEQLVARLKPFHVLCVMRERTPLHGDLLRRLPNLKMIASTGPVNASIDTETTKELGITVVHTGYDSTPTIEMSWAMIMALARNIIGEVNSVRNGGWQQKVGVGLRGKTLGILGLGHVGGGVARIGQAFGMEVIAWSQNLTPEKAQANGAIWVPKPELFERSDFLSIHMILSMRTKGLVNAEALALMKPTSYLINMSRGPVIDDQALINVLRARKIAGAGLDVFDIEPLPVDHPFRSLDNVIATPHIGYVSQELYKIFYSDCVRNIGEWLDKNANN